MEPSANIVQVSFKDQILEVIVHLIRHIVRAFHMNLPTYEMAFRSTTQCTKIYPLASGSVPHVDNGDTEKASRIVLGSSILSLVTIRAYVRVFVCRGRRLVDLCISETFR